MLFSYIYLAERKQFLTCNYFLLSSKCLFKMYNGGIESNIPIIRSGIK